MKIDIAVCGRFHFHKYLSKLSEFKLLNRFYYSYKINFNFGLDRRYRYNYPLKEYLMFFNIRYLKKWRFFKNLLIFHQIWERQVASNTPRADILHVMIHGNSEKIIEKYKAFGKLIIGEAVNAYPKEQLKLVEKEFREYGLSSLENQNFDKLTEAKMIREFKKCDYILTPSNFVRNSFIRNGFRENRVICLPYGSEIPKDLYYKTKLSSDYLKILCVAQITFRKGQIYLVKALKKLKQEGYKFKLTFVGKIDAQYWKAIQDLGLDFYIEHIDFIPHSEISGFMRKFDIHILPSIEDGFGLVVTEALSVGVPVIATRNAGSSEVIVEGRNGFVVDAANVNALKCAIIKSYGYEFTIQGRDIGTWEEYVNQLISIYRKII